MRKIIFRGSAKTVGTDFAEAALYPDDTPDHILDRDCWEAAVANSEMYGWELVDDYDYDSEDDSYYDNYCTYDDINGYWEEYDPEEHDGHRAGGGSFEEDFARQAERM